MSDLKSDLITLLENIYSNYGYQSIQKTIEGMTDRQLDQIKDKIIEVKDVISERNKIKERKREIMIEDKKRLDPESATAHLTKAKANKIKDPRLVCEFWGTYDKNFIEEDVKDLHYLESWPKLTSCPGWEQIIEKSALNAHILTEWENKDNFEQWKDWKEPYKKDEHENHLTVWSKDNNS